MTRNMLAAATVALLSATLASGQQPQTEDQRQLEQAEALLESFGNVLFSAPTVSTDDEKLLEAITRDLHSLEFAQDPKGAEPVSSVFGTNPLTSDANPLLTEARRKSWLAQAIGNVGYEMAEAHLREQATALASGAVSRAQWYDHVVQCTSFCGPVVQGLLLEHIRTVASLPHLLLTFPTNSAAVSADQVAALDGFIAEHQKAGLDRVLLIGRASRTGNRQYNRELSAKRAEAVRVAVTSGHSAPETASAFWLGYEPPQITDEIARAYRLDPRLTDLARNQSVMVVAHASAGQPVASAGHPGRPE